MNRFVLKLVFRTAAMLVLHLSFLNCVADAQIDDKDYEYFENLVRPILAQHCNECHGVDADPIQGGLSMASRAAILAGGDTGPAIEPGNPDDSLLIDAINYRGYYEMPPDSRLADEQIEILTKWVARGAPWPDHGDHAQATAKAFDLQARKAQHWCWQPIRKMQPPAVSQSDWPLQPLDNFILARLETAGLQPAVDSERRSWIRRVYFDLIGLPPTPEEIMEFVNDPAETAFATVVDHLLASDHFGERWARHWMDLIRYAETYGHEFDYPIAHAWQYRDYLIRAFNADVPFDDFIREQIAGDMIEQPRQHPTAKYNESVLGTGFWFMGEATHGPVDVKADEAGRIDNQIDVLCKTFLGVTVACARCHDHKFDAISAEDYYALSGFLQSSRRQTALLDPDQKIAGARKRIQQELAPANRLISELLTELSEIEVAHIKDDLQLILDNDTSKVQVNAVDWKELLQSTSIDDQSNPLHILKLARQKTMEDFQREFATIKQQFDKQAQQQAAFVSQSALYEGFEQGIPEGWFVTGWAFDGSPGQFPFSVAGNQISSAANASSGRFGGKFQGVLRSPTFEITHDCIFVRAQGSACQIRLIIDGFELDVHNPLLFNGCRHDLNSPDRFTWVQLAGDIRNYRGHKAYLEFIDHGDSFCEIDEIRFADADCPLPGDPPSKLAEIIIEQMPTNPSELIFAVATTLKSVFENPANLPLNESSLLFSTIVPHTEFGKALFEHRIANEKELAALPSPLMAVAMTDGTGEDENLFIRGNSKTLGAVVQRRFLTALDNERGAEPNLITGGSGRLELAQQIADRDNPLTSRVIVNRIWHHLLGQGIVASVDNFGLLGKTPSHPELLDYLADTFCDDQWSIKTMIRRIALSRTYRMSSSKNEAGSALDPDNLLLHRTHVKRLEGEAIRDSILKISGSLDSTLYGESVPVYLTEFMQGRGRPQHSGPLDGRGRRSVYIEVRRNFLSPMMLSFDTPIPFNTIGNRHESNVPAQALIMMNDPFILEQAGKWATQIMQHSPDQDDRIQRIFHQALGRTPTLVELQSVGSFLNEQAIAYNIVADKLIDHEPIWQDLCHAVFNMKEFIFVQ